MKARAIASTNINNEAARQLIPLSQPSSSQYANRERSTASKNRRKRKRSAATLSLLLPHIDTTPQPLLQQHEQTQLERVRNPENQPDKQASRKRQTEKQDMPKTTMEGKELRAVDEEEVEATHPLTLMQSFLLGMQTFNKKENRK